MDVTIALFILVYIAMGVGHLPGFGVDRTGAAVVGAMLLIAFGEISPAGAWAAIDYRTIGLLFGLMIISSAFVVSGFYDWAARKVGGLRVGPSILLAILVVVGGLLSAVLTNDVVVVAMTPVLTTITLARGLNPVPFLLGFCFAANVGSAATLIGSPQNMVAAETLHLTFSGFMQVAAIPALLGLPLVWLVLAICYRGRWELADTARAATADGAVAAAPVEIPFDRFETGKAALVTVAVIAAFVLTDWPHMLVALAGASVLLVNRQISSNDMLRLVDGNLLLLLMGLFVVNAALASTGIPQDILDGLRGVGLDLHEPISMLVVMSVLSNVVGNNPAVMLVAPFLNGAEGAEALGAAIALGTGFSSNAIVFGSLAGIIVVEQARLHGITIRFAEFARAGIPASLLSLVLAVAWIVYLGS
ncbi:transporter [Acuticoccus sp. M5D2P5]|uniref:SLC13 family permease n=1 Tax=Acuticoccus kalidii TaxID=2910977 RepID=UPI001F3ADFCF|nr:SLC13 family permease [Acuticoccus kalidii]MCF3932035.1 transporter [Acuticoccus kalidii]